MDAKPEALAHPPIKPGPIVVAADRLEALTKAYDDRVGEIRNSGDNGHGCNGCVPIRLGCQIEADGGQTGHSLPQEGGETAVHNFPVQGAGNPNIAKADFHDACMIALIKQDQKAYQLADDGCPGSAADAQAAPEDQNGVQNDV